MYITAHKIENRSLNRKDEGIGACDHNCKGEEFYSLALAEKNATDQIEFVTIDVMKGEHRTQDFLRGLGYMGLGESSTNALIGARPCATSFSISSMNRLALAK